MNNDKNKIKENNGNCNRLRPQHPKYLEARAIPTDYAIEANIFYIDGSSSISLDSLINYFRNLLSYPSSRLIIPYKVKALDGVNRAHIRRDNSVYYKGTPGENEKAVKDWVSDTECNSFRSLTCKPAKMLPSSLDVKGMKGFRPSVPLINPIACVIYDTRYLIFIDLILNKSFTPFIYSKKYCVYGLLGGEGFVPYPFINSSSSLRLEACYGV
jgi:hypothetical protein